MLEQKEFRLKQMNITEAYRFKTLGKKKDGRQNMGGVTSG